MIRTESSALDGTPRAVASGIYGFSVDAQGAAVMPVRALVRYDREGAPERSIIVQAGRWYAGADRIESLSLATAGAAGDYYVTSSDAPEDIVVP